MSHRRGGGRERTVRARYAAIYYPGENTRHAENAGRTERVELSRTVRVVVVVVVPSSKYAFSRKRPAENGKLQDRPWTGRARAVAVRAGPESGALITRPNLLGLSLFGGIPPRVPDDGYFDGFARAIVTADVPAVVEFVPFSNRRALDTSQYIPPPTSGNRVDGNRTNDDGSCDDTCDSPRPERTSLGRRDGSLKTRRARRHIIDGNATVYMTTVEKPYRREARSARVATEHYRPANTRPPPHDRRLRPGDTAARNVPVQTQARVAFNRFAVRHSRSRTSLRYGHALYYGLSCFGFGSFSLIPGVTMLFSL